MSLSKRWKGLTILSVIGTVTAVISLYHHIAVKTGYLKGPSFCAISSSINCDVVTRSIYAEVGGVPIASITFIYYFAVLIFVLFRQQFHVVDTSGDSLSRNTVWSDVMFALSAIALIPTSFLAFVSFFKLSTVCLLCLTMDVINVLMLVLSWGLPYRSYSWPKAVLKGTLAIWRFFLGGKVLSDSDNPYAVVVSSRLALISLISLVTAVFFFPAFLAHQILFPNRAEIGWDEAIRFFNQWQRGPLENLIINDSEDALTRDYARGPRDASVELVIFSDFECPFCLFAAKTIERVLPAYEKYVRVVFKNFPLDNSCNKKVSRSLHLRACRAALLARCAGEQGEHQFWQAHDTFFSHPGVSDRVLDDFMRAPGIDSDSLQRCMTSGIMEKKIERDIDEAVGLKISGTPALFINRRRLDGGITEQGLRVLLTFLTTG